MMQYLLGVGHTMLLILNTNAGLAFGLGVLLSGVLTSVSVLTLRAVHGSYITNLSLALEARRTLRKDDKKHDLVVVLKIEKESTNALTLESMKVELFSLDQNDLNDGINDWYKLPEHRSKDGSQGIFGYRYPDKMNTP